jgi:uncharacterized membrane protein YczE
MTTIHRLDLVPQRVIRLGSGLVLFGVSVGVMLAAGLGVGSWDVFHQGLAERTGITFGWVLNGVSIGVLLLWIPLRQPPGFGTLANALVVGVVADLILRVLTTPEGFAAQLALLILGIVANGAATGLYIGAGLGAGPRDGLMTGLAFRTGRSIRAVRTVIEITVVAAGWALGGPVGLGTVLYAISIGPLSQFFLTRLSIDRRWQHSKRQTMENRPPVECRP